MRLSLTKTTAVFLTALTAWAGLSPALAQPAAWPQKPIRLLVGFPGGSTPDMAARAIAPKISEQLKVPVIIENKPGASGNIATDQTAKSSDGHTFGIVINGNLTSAKMLYPKLPYEPAKDFSYISLIGTAPLILLSRNGLPAGKEFFSTAVQNASRLNYGSVGNGSVAHLGMELLADKVPGLKPTHIPYQGNTHVITALIAKEIDMALIPPGIALPQASAGKVQAIGATSEKASEIAPGIAPLSDLGIKGFNLEVWTAMVAPKNLPPADQEKMVRAVQTALGDAGVRKQLVTAGWQAPDTPSPAQLQTLIERETQLMKSIIDSHQIRLD
ncbi:Bug family tripartite tricarboxylate transporter substrate binding protein [Comamonas composti]|uniref:Bug family tripartite tricarboxylate transporter substrate binding protein n=1 Tax=Comamonas composti TaxID=408558 RepID=UPI00042383D4|nr:tripartite tricarboxylate transporter substrate binding protein [Comamonas composti]